MKANHPLWETGLGCASGCVRRDGTQQTNGRVAPLRGQVRMKAPLGCMCWVEGQTETFHTWRFLSSQWEWEGRKETSGSSRTVKFLRSHSRLGDKKWGWKVGKRLTFFFRQDCSAHTLEGRAPAFVLPVHCRILVVKTSGFAATEKKSEAEKLGLCRYAI